MLHIPEEGICSPSGSTAWRENIVDLRDFQPVRSDQTGKKEKTKLKKNEKKQVRISLALFSMHFRDMRDMYRYVTMMFNAVVSFTSPKVPCTLRICEVKEGKGKVPELALVVRHVDKVVVTSGTVGHRGSCKALMSESSQTNRAS